MEIVKSTFLVSVVTIIHFLKFRCLKGKSTVEFCSPNMSIPLGNYSFCTWKESEKDAGHWAAQRGWGLTHSLAHLQILPCTINRTNNTLPAGPYRCFRVTQPQLAPGSCLRSPPPSLVVAGHTPLSWSCSSTPFLWSPLQPDQTLPSYLNIHKAPA